MLLVLPLRPSAFLFIFFLGDDEGEVMASVDGRLLHTMLAAQDFTLRIKVFLGGPKARRVCAGMRCLATLQSLSSVFPEVHIYLA